MKRIDDTKANMYAQMGMAALLPGFQYALELMQRQLDEFRATLAALQNGAAPAKRGPGRLRNAPLPVAGSGQLTARGTPLKKGYWAQFTPEERVAEMRRRREVQMANKAVHPRDPRHPGHAEWLRTVGKAAKKSWAKLTPAQKRDRLAKMAAGRNGKPSVRMEAA